MRGAGLHEPMHLPRPAIIRTMMVVGRRRCIGFRHGEGLWEIHRGHGVGGAGVGMQVWGCRSHGTAEKMTPTQGGGQKGWGSDGVPSLPTLTGQEGVLVSWCAFPAYLDRPASTLGLGLSPQMCPGLNLRTSL